MTQPADRLLFEAVRARKAEELREVRAAAANWRTALAAMLGLVATVALVKGRDSVAGLGLTIRIVVGCILLTAVITAAVGAFVASRSAFGLPKEEEVPARLSDLVVVEQARIRRAVRDLRAAIALTFVTLALIVAAVGLVWYG
ncbi:hypothetical protein [Amycolatopsis sp. NPDC004625]|uniref:hypothetical protein n=1 Tax=Amycolatopsis sp. NPDC004625 TaxID=3154670 RepID=UPI00339E6F16